MEKGGLEKQAGRSQGVWVQELDRGGGNRRFAVELEHLFYGKSVPFQQCKSHTCKGGTHAYTSQCPRPIDCQPG